MRAVFCGIAALFCASPAAAQADLSGFWAPDFTTAARDQSMLDKLPPNTVLVEDTGVAEFPRGEFGGLKLTPSARVRADEWQAEDEMTLQRVCLVPSIVYSIQGPFPFEVLQTRDVIVFKYEYFDQIRTVFMDGRAHPPVDAPHSKMGFSTGRWEGGELVVDTSHISASTITNNGLDHSEDITMVERYRISADGTALVATQWFSDPAVIENNGARYMSWSKKAGEFVYPYECDPSFALEYQQLEGNSAD